MNFSEREMTMPVHNMYLTYLGDIDPKTASWPLMQGPAPTITVVALYLAFVKIIGPAWMIKRQPFDLRSLMLVHNVMLSLVNVFIAIEGFKLLYKGNVRSFCLAYDDTDWESTWVAQLGWLFFATKFMELADTVFFILRKNFRCLTFLHITHHAGAPLVVWIGLKIEPGGCNCVFPFLNVIVHSLMYFYYGLAAMGPTFKRFLWWKKQLTLLQLGQFAIAFLSQIYLLATGHQNKYFIACLNMVVAAYFFVMFSFFYYESYVKVKPPKKTK